MTCPKIVICGAGFLGSLLIPAHSAYFPADACLLGTCIAKEIAACTSFPRQIQMSSRQPQKAYETLTMDRTAKTRLLPPVAVDIRNRDSLRPAFENASVVVSLVGILHGSPQDFNSIQFHGAENVATVAKEVGAKVIHFSAIGADPHSQIPYVRTKGLGEDAVLKICPDATIVRPSLVFGPEDDFFNVK